MVEKRGRGGRRGEENNEKGRTISSFYEGTCVIGSNF
jgi:hypothetical protein